MTTKTCNQAMSQQVYFISNDEAQDILKDRLAAVERCLMSLNGQDDIKVIKQTIEIIEKRIWDCKNLAEEIQKKREEESATE